MLAAAIGDRMEQVGLRLHPDKTRIVYCRDGRRMGSFEHTAFDFLGFTFRARAVRSRHGSVFTGFGPAVSKTAMRKMGEVVWPWRLHRRTNLTEQDLARWLNPIVAGRMNYYGRFYRSELYPLLRRINVYLARWPPTNTRASSRTGDRFRSSDGEVEKSPVTGDCHAGICGSSEVRPLRATRLLSSETNPHLSIML